MLHAREDRLELFGGRAPIAEKGGELFGFVARLQKEVAERVRIVSAKKVALHVGEEKRERLRQHRDTFLRAEKFLQKRRARALHTGHEQRTLDHRHPQM